MDIDITQYLRLMVEKDASDMFFSTGAPVALKIEGKTVPVSETRLEPGVVKHVAYSMMNDDQQREFESTIAIEVAGANGIEPSIRDADER